MKSTKMYMNIRTFKKTLFMIVDILVIFIAFILAYIIEYHFVPGTALSYMGCIALFHLITFGIFNIYNVITDHFGITDVIRFGLLILLINVCAAVGNRVITQIPNLSILMFAFVAAFESILIVGSRCVQRVIRFYSTPTKGAVPTMIIGAGAAGKIAYDEMHCNKEFHNLVVCFGDEDSSKIGKRYLGKPVVGPISKAHEIIVKYKIKEVVIAISDIDKKHLTELINTLSNENVKIKRMPLLAEMTDPTQPLRIKNVSLDELLGREQITFDTKEIGMWLKGKTVLITGGGGSIGSELARQVYQFKSKKLILFDIYENAAYEIQQELASKIKHDHSDMELITLIGSTYNLVRTEEIFAKYRPDIVLHAAAYKHVPLMEDSPVEAIRTNCLGTYNVAMLADKYYAQKMVLVSTDKAVRPTNVMGATKAFAEMIIRYWDEKSIQTSYSAVRFGNVLGSNGSVIPLFKKQIAEGGPVTVTHPNIIRYFMTIPEAVSLILQSGVYATGGEIFILDMGNPVKIVTLAENVIKQSGYIPYEDIDIVFTGLRPGEKLFEELLLNATHNTKTSNAKIFVEEKTKTLPMDEKIEFISQVFTMTNNDEIKNCLRKVVTNYTNYKDFNAEIDKDTLEEIGNIEKTINV